MSQRWFEVFDRGSEYSLYGLILFIPISNAAIEICFGFTFLCFLVKKIIRPDFRFLRSAVYVFLSFFIIFITLSIFNSRPYLAKSLEALFFKWLEYICLFLIVQDTFINRRRLNNAASILLLVAAIVGLDAILQYFGGIEFLRQRGPVLMVVRGLYGVTGPFKHFNDFGAYLVCVLSLAIGLLSSRKIKRDYRVGLFFIVGLLGWVLLLTYCRGSWVGLGVSLGLMLYLSRRRIKVIIALICVFILALVLTPIVRERCFYIFQRGGGSGRFGIWQAAWGMIKENPFLGKGLGTFMARFSQYAIPTLGIQYTHNCFLQIWAETGIFTLLIFLVFLGILLWRGIKALKISPDPLLLGLICGILGFLTHSFFDTQFYSLQLAVLFWVLLGMISASTSTIDSVSLDKNSQN